MLTVFSVINFAYIFRECLRIFYKTCSNGKFYELLTYIEVVNIYKYKVSYFISYLFVKNIIPLQKLGVESPLKTHYFEKFGEKWETECLNIRFPIPTEADFFIISVINE